MADTSLIVLTPIWFRPFDMSYPSPGGRRTAQLCCRSIQLLPKREVRNSHYAPPVPRESPGIRTSPLMESEPMNPLFFGFQGQYAPPALRRVDIKLGALPR